MKRTLTMLALLFTLHLGMAAQPQSNMLLQNEDEGYNGVKILGAGLYLGYWGYSYFGTRSLAVPPLNVYFELGVHEYITVGPFVGYGRWDYRYVNSDYSWSFLHLGARGSFHFSNLFNEWFGSEIDAEKLDLYLTVISGLEIRNFNSSAYPDLYDNTWRIFFGPTAGLRYYLGRNFAVYVEGGRGSLGALNLGVSTRF